MGKITIHCVRHAQGYHNISVANHQLPDPDLTPVGEEQCRELQAKFPYHDRLTHLVASPLRRTIYTCLYGFAPSVASGKKVIALPELQEASSLPCDTGSDPAKLQAEFGESGNVDLSLVTEGWNSKTGKWASDAKSLEKRAREARIWLRELGSKLEGDADIVVVTHGGFLHYFTEDWNGHEKFEGTGWANTEFRSYTFVDESLRDVNASLIETEESRAYRNFESKPLSEDEQKELRATAEQKWGSQGFQDQGKL